MVGLTSTKAGSPACTQGIEGRMKELEGQITGMNRNSTEESLRNVRTLASRPKLTSPGIPIAAMKVLVGNTTKSGHSELHYLRSACSDDNFFVGSSCHAEMAKSISYKMYVSFDSDGYIQESQCECAADMGPNAHCKHVCTVLYAMSEFSRKKQVVVEQTCTERLQTFHHVKRNGIPTQV